MKYTPLPKNKKNSVLFIVLLCTAAALFYLGAQYYTEAKSVVQAAGVLFLALSSFFLIKKLTGYTYAVYPKEPSDEKSVSEYRPDELSFVVAKHFGTGPDTNKASLDLACLTKTVSLPFSYFEKKKIIKAEGKMALYYYTVTFKPPESLLLVFGANGEKTGIVIEPDTDFTGFLEEVVKINTEKTPSA